MGRKKKKKRTNIEMEFMASASLVCRENKFEGIAFGAG